MTYTIDKSYKGGVPRGQYYRSAIVNLATDQTVGLTVSPTTSPEQWALLVDTLRFVPNSPVAQGTGSGLIELSYPDYVGENQVTYVFDDEDSILDFADEVVDGAGNTQYVIKLKPPVLLRASNSETDLTVGFPTDRDLASGDISFLVTGWQIKESDYD